MLQFEQKLAEKGCVVFYCTSLCSELYERCKARGETYITTIEQFRAIHYEYEQLMHYKTHLVPIFRYTLGAFNGFKGLIECQK